MAAHPERSSLASAEHLPDTPISGSRSLLQKFRSVYFACVAGAVAFAGSPVRSDDGAPVPVQEGVQGTIIAVGGGDLTEEIHKRFLELAGGRRAGVVVIPTASERADLPGQDVRSYWEHQPEEVGSVSIIHTHDPEEANSEEFVKPLQQASAVWLAGGKQARLEKAYVGTRVQQELKNLLGRGGVIGGTSAGTAILTKRIIREGSKVAVTGTGFGLAREELVFDQHFFKRNRRERLQSLIESDPKLRGIGIAEQTAVEIRGNVCRVLGNGSVELCVPGGTSRLLGPGESIDLTSFINLSADSVLQNAVKD